MFIMDGDSWDKIPDDWKNIKFGEVDVLIVAPLGLQDPQAGTFGIIPQLMNRFSWILSTARAAPRLIPGTSIKILVSQFWGDDPQVWGHPLSALPATAIDAYAKSVRDFLVAYNLDGYDIDYEPANIVSTVPAILAAIRAQLDDLSNANGGRPYYTTVSPGDVEFLSEAVASVSGVNVQTYSGGFYTPISTYLNLGFEPGQLLYGLNAETPSESHSIDEALTTYNESALAGIHLWRLNSTDLLQENEWQDEVYRQLHSLV